MHNPELQGKFREMLTAFYTVLKDADPWLRFVFITGVTKFAQMGIFSQPTDRYKFRSTIQCSLWHDPPGN